MDDPPEPNITELLVAARAGDAAAGSRLWESVYDELHELAHRRLGRERRPLQLQTTSLLHEVFLRLGGTSALTFDNRAHFFGAAARAMRQVLIDGARARDRQKRGGDIVMHPLGDQAVAATGFAQIDLLALDEALQRLHAFDSRKATIVELRFFAGLTVAHVAEVLDMAVGSVSEEWKIARLWLHRELMGGDDGAR
ncbi:MAG: RNA polymerase subunit sigma [Planctomycetes bacterium]|nr:RNA polymerase subunit sigma [Planctomycetota bacterium]